jgi:hypothetical protein
MQGVTQSSATLVITGGDFDPASVTELLDLRPFKCWQKGDQRVHQNGTIHTQPYSGWKLAHDSKLDHETLNEQLKYWINLLRPRDGQLKRIRKLGASIEIMCFLMCGPSPALTLSADVLAALGVLEVDLTVECLLYEEH